MMDWETLLCKKRMGKSNSKNSLGIESEFEKDYFEIIRSASFRRLQDKTQVFSLSQNDYVRTRLTHSVEVACIAKTIADIACKNKQDMCAHIEEIGSVLQCAGLLHDIGNPPLGHNGENVINNWYVQYLEEHNIDLSDQMKEDLKHVEGNSQALRVISRLHHARGNMGMQLTDAVVSAIIKYPVSSAEIEGSGYKKMGYLLSEKNIYEEIRKNTGFVGEYQKARNPLVYILEAADDIAYAFADIEDAVKNHYMEAKEVLDLLKKCDSPFEKTIAEMIQDKANKKGLDISNLDNKDLKKADKENLEEILEEIVEDIVSSLRIKAINYAGNRFYRYYEQIMNGSLEIKDLFDCELKSKDDLNNNENKILKVVDELKKYQRAHTFFNRDSELSIKIYMGILERYLDVFVPAILSINIEDRTPDESASADIWNQRIFSNWNKEEDRNKEIEMYQEKCLNLISKHAQDVYMECLNSITEGTDTQKRNYLKMLLINDYIMGMTDSYAFKYFMEKTF